MIYDGHAYIIQRPDQNGGFDSPSEFWQTLQMYMATARQQPAWRKRDRKPADSSGLVDPKDTWNYKSLKNANFRAGSHGQVEWTVDNEDYVKQVLPTYIRDLSFGADDLVAEMDYAGVDRALLHRTPYMSRSNEFIAAACKLYPDRIQGLAIVEEWLIDEDPAYCIKKIDRAVKTLGLHGLQFAAQHRPQHGKDEDWDSAKARPYWDAVAALGIPVFFTLAGVTTGQHYREMDRLRKWMQRYSKTKVVKTHGFDYRSFIQGDKVIVPDDLIKAIPYDAPNFEGLQVLFSVFLQRSFDYPLQQCKPAMEKFVKLIGPRKLVWGTDVPIGNLFWTYKQNQDYVRKYMTDILGPAEMALVMGDNMERIMRA
ncbi:MAG: hypothetical protein FJ319_12595 [SAR202 cluster bacterium]|nr:hypothetical protein [SAR202 cluster bacterium]